MKNEKLNKAIENLQIAINELKEATNDKPTFEVGKVYKDLRTDSLKGMYYITKIEGNIFHYFGFDCGGVWQEEDWYDFLGCDLTEATEEEWKARLIEEAVKRGYQNSKFKCLEGWTEKETSKWEKEEKIKFICNEYGKSLYIEGINYLTLLIMHNGKWAEIVKEEYEIGTFGVFWDTNKELESKEFVTGFLTLISNTGKFKCNDLSCHFTYFKPAELTIKD